LSSPFDHLDDDTRAKLVELLERRSLYYHYCIELNRLRIDVIRLQTPEAVKKAINYSELQVRPLRESMREIARELSPKAINTECIDDMLPAVALPWLRA
jgi:hypothetical protein